MNPEVTEHIENLRSWKKEITALREIVLSSGLEETLKWKQPCYTHRNKNVLIISGFKDYCSLNFFKGSLLPDPEGLLVAAGNNSQAARQLRFRNMEEINSRLPAIRVFINEALHIEETGKKVHFKKVNEYELPQELREQFTQSAEFETAFRALTPGRQKAYILHFSGAKQAQTRLARIERYTPRILNGKGINDCVCGLSKRMPGCDGSHKHIPDWKENLLY